MHLSAIMRHWTLALAITGFVVAVLMSITLLVFWYVYIIGDFQTIRDLSQALGHQQVLVPTLHRASIRWSVLAIGSGFFAVIITALSLFFAGYLVHRRYRRQQIDWLNLTTHELKLPTANIQLFAQMLQKRRLSEGDRERFVDLVLQEARRLDEMVSRILQARRIESGMQELRLSRIPIHTWLAECRERPGVMGFVLASEIPAVMVRGDRKLLEIVLDNFVQNAHKYGDGSPPTVHVLHQNGMVTIEVHDRGIGVPNEFARRIFKRFFRVPAREHRRRTGTGLGLYIARSVVQLHHGKVGYRPVGSAPGSIFWFSLPEIL